MNRKPFSRAERVAGLLRRELPQLVRERLDDPRLSHATITDVVLSRDLAYADVYVMTLDPDAGPAAIEALNESARVLRHELARRVDLRSVPELRFAYDIAIEQAARIDALLNPKVE